MKKIALTQRIIKNPSYYEIREVLDINWGKLINDLGFEILILPLQYDFKKLSFDGLILTGGNDLSTVSGDNIDKLRDDFEYSLLDYCVMKKIPVVGICRGMQMINAYFGGTVKKVEHHVGIEHVLDNGIKVNSFHSFAIDQIGKGLKATAKADDGVIEILQHEQYKIYAQMHHPERIDPFSNYDLNFIRNYFND
jgi:putative glutamine amidotransferase